MRGRRTATFAGAWLATCIGQASAQQTAAPTVDLPTIDVIAATPLSGSGVDVDKVPAAVTSVNAKKIAEERSASVVKALAAATPSLDVQEVSGNPFQPDVDFRGFDASPVAGTPQGLAVYQNGVRINEAFGDLVNWDLIPTVAIRSADVVSANPVFGLNALGGAISLKMKDGFGFQGASVDVMSGSYGRFQASLQVGKQVGDWAAYFAAETVSDNGYRQHSGSQIRRLYGDVGYKGDASEFHLSVGAASNHFGATATAPFELLQQNWSNVYTTPQTSANQVGYVNAAADVTFSPTWSLQGLAYVRKFWQRTVDGNTTNAQPCDDPTLLCYGDSATPAYGTNGAQLANPFASTATLGEIDRTSTQTTSVGASLQATDSDKLLGHDNHLVFGASVDYGVNHFGASAELGTIQNDFSVAGSGLFLGPSGDPIADGPVSLNAANLYTGLYAVDTLDATDRLSLTAGARLNLADIKLSDQLGTTLNGHDDFAHFNPMLGATYKLTPELTAYAGASISNRAPTPLELGCADPNHPCVLASFLVSDPPLKQVVSDTLEAGLRGKHDFGADVGTLTWKLGAFRTDSHNDILNVADPLQQGFGYFVNVGTTRRQGLEAEAEFKADKYALTASYAYLDATFLNSLQLASNSPAAVNGVIQVNPGNQIPMTPHSRLKLAADYSLTESFKLGAELSAVGPQYFAGDASNQEAKLPGYAVVNANASYRATKTIEFYARVENVLDRHYYTYGTYFDAGSVPNYANGGAAFVDPRSLSPAAPRALYAGMRASF